MLAGGGEKGRRLGRDAGAVDGEVGEAAVGLHAGRIVGGDDGFLRLPHVACDEKEHALLEPLTKLFGRPHYFAASICRKRSRIQNYCNVGRLSRK